MADVTTDIATNGSNEATELDALVVGAGFAGLYQLLCLRDRLGLSVKALEAGGGVGGTWYWNRYPGARCDSESHVYWYTFSSELMREWEWSERYPGQSEIMRYLNHVADRFDLKRDILFNTRVAAAHYDEIANRWRVRTENGDTFTVKFLITAVGCLSTANVPKFAGLESFTGDWYHTGQWPHEGVDFTGKRVGMIGTGSTGIQAAPVIAASAAHLTVFQRTANYSVPARNAPLTPEFRRYIKENPAEIRAVTRETLNGMAFRIEERLAVETPPEEREAIYEAAWERGGLQFRAAFKDMMVDKAANDTAADFVKRKIRSIVKDPKKAAILSGIDHPYAAKRPPIWDLHFCSAPVDGCASASPGCFSRCSPRARTMRGWPRSASRARLSRHRRCCCSFRAGRRLRRLLAVRHWALPPSLWCHSRFRAGWWVNGWRARRCIAGRWTG